MSDAAARMDRMYRRQRRIYDLSRKFYLLGRDATIAEIAARPGQTILEIACGTARNLIKLAKAYPQSPCFGVDISAEMLASAACAVRRAGLSRRIALARADAISFDPVALFGRETFDRIVISYALSMIPAWPEALAHALDKLAPAGSLHIVDFGDQAGLPIWLRLALNGWLAAFDVTPRKELTTIVAKLGEARSLRWRASRRFGGYAVCATVERAP